MEYSSSDIFLLLASFKDSFLSKSFIKKLFHSVNDFSFLFLNEPKHILPKINPEEVGKLNEIKKIIKELNLNEIKRDLNRTNSKFIAYCDREYPMKLKEISDPPFGLFYKGNLELFNNSKFVGIIGTRSATSYGKNITQKIAVSLAEQNVVIVSGMASGIDSYAHIGAMEKGKTVAVLGTGPDIVFPASNKNLYEQIIHNGSLVVSEYPPETQGNPWNFPQRNRIISALSDAVVVIEGDLQSGALITARFAIKQDKPLFALPGPIDAPMSNGPNILIKSGVAELLTSVNDVLEKIGGEKQIKLDLQDKDKKIDFVNEKQKNVYDALSVQPKNFDCLLQETDLEVQELLKHLSMLELKGVVEKTSDGGYVKC